MRGKTPTPTEWRPLGGPKPARRTKRRQLGIRASMVVMQGTTLRSRVDEGSHQSPRSKARGHGHEDIKGGSRDKLQPPEARVSIAANCAEGLGSFSGPLHGIYRPSLPTAT